MKIAVLALQGAFEEHSKMLSKLDAQSKEIRQKSDFYGSFDGLIIPGGESTVMDKLLRELGLFDDVKSAIQGGMPVFGTCAGLILLAKEIENGGEHLGLMDIRACRNAYGRQLGSFAAHSDFAGLGEIPMTFIRAPYIKSVSGTAVSLAEVDNKIVAARQENMLVTAFHPELNNNPTVHEYFLNMCR
ncbi:MAG: pyridoxal 5'-phosphate synthase glutaminase subunit PdxT [Ruminococcus sp.]|nr:pyridoxal 5'-phosphate synthase glutaminase subunit PdxT [Ruminococcus sp.]